MNATDRSQYTDATLPLWREAFACLDWFSLHCAPVYAGFGVTRGHGDPVVVVPGLMASDASLMELFGWLRRCGYRPYYSRIGRNAGCPDVVVERLLKTIDRAYEECGARVTIIGHSLGGVLARGIALRRPRAIARVITLGAPVNGARVHPAVFMAGEFVHGNCDGACAARMQAALPSGIAEYNIYSRSDGIVGWRTCRRDDATCIEVRGTHVGLIVNPQVYRALGRVLAVPAKQAPPPVRHRVARATKRSHLRGVAARLAA